MTQVDPKYLTDDYIVQGDMVFDQEYNLLAWGDVSYELPPLPPVVIPEGFVGTGTIIEGDVDPRELYSEAISLLEKGESIEHLGLPEDVTIEGLQEALYDLNLAVLGEEQNPLAAYVEAVEQDPLITYDPEFPGATSDGSITEDTFFATFNENIAGLPLYSEPVETVSGASFFEMIFANIDANDVNLI